MSPQCSTRLQARYVQDLAMHFEDGRLSDEIIATLDDAQLYDRLTAVKGIGPWTVHMFMMFTLGRWVCGLRLGWLCVLFNVLGLQA